LRQISLTQLNSPTPKTQFRAIWVLSFLGGIATRSLKVILPVATHVTVAWSVRLSVCVYVTHVAMSLAPSNTVLDRTPVPPLEGEIWGSKPLVRRDAAYCQIT